ncbi:MAG: zf-HC2 domain-containing protein [Myxococcota bacterium]
MACERHADDLMGYLYGELSPREADAFLAHARTCDSCNGELAQLASVRKTVALAAPLPDPPDALTARILDVARTAAASPPVAATTERVGLLDWLMKPWSLGLAAAGAGLAAVMLVSTSKLSMKSPEAVVQEVAPAAAPQMAAEPAVTTPRADLAAKEAKPVEPTAGAGGDEAALLGAAVAEKAVDAPRGAANGVALRAAAPADEEALRDRAPPSKDQQPAMGEVADKVEPAPARQMEAQGKREVAAPLAAAPAPAAEPSPESTAETDDVAARRVQRSEEKVAELKKAKAPASWGVVASEQPRARGPETGNLTLPPPPASPPAEARAEMEAYRDDDGREGAARGAAGAGAMGGGSAPPPAASAPAQPLRKPSLAVPGMKADLAESRSSPVKSVMEDERKRLKQAETGMKAQAEMTAGAEYLASGRATEALAAFQRAEALDTTHELSPNPRVGQAAALALSGRCEDALRLARGVGQTHPAFSKRSSLLTDVAKCFERKGDAVVAQQLRNEAGEVTRQQTAHAGEDAQSERAAAIVHTVKLHQAGVTRCEIAATQDEELPAAAGVWTVKVTVASEGRATEASAQGPREAPGLRACLERHVRGISYGASTAKPQTVEVKLPIVPRGSVEKARKATKK